MDGRTRNTPPPAEPGTFRVGPGSSPGDLSRALHLLDPFASGTDDAERTAGGDEQPDCTGVGPWFDASYSGECTGCWDVIDPGDRIRTDGTGGYLCEDCGNEDGLA